MASHSTERYYNSCFQLVTSKLFFYSLRRQNEDLRAKLSLFEGSSSMTSEVMEAETNTIKTLHEKECRELRLTIKSLVTFLMGYYSPRLYSGDLNSQLLWHSNGPK